MPKPSCVADVPNLGPAIDRLRELVAQSGDHLLLGDGPPHPDAKLLDLCAEGLHHLRRAEKANEHRHELRRSRFGRKNTPAEHAEEDHLYQLYNDGIERSRAPLVMIGRIPATTAAGIYAKAMVVRASRSGAAKLAMTLADDLVNNAALRALVWGAEPASAPVAPTIVAQAD